MAVAIRNLTRRPFRGRRVFSDIAASVLPEWDISLVFVTPAKARALNYQLRNKDYTPNVLSYALGDKSAEIIICPAEAAKQAPEFLLSASSFLLLLFIHGLLHIKGWAHGATMEKCERKLLKRYGPKNSDRHRHRHLPSKNGSGRGTLR